MRFARVGCLRAKRSRHGLHIVRRAHCAHAYVPQRAHAKLAPASGCTAQSAPAVPPLTGNPPRANIARTWERRGCRVAT